MERDALKGGESRKARGPWHYRKNTSAKPQGWRFEVRGLRHKKKTFGGLFFLPPTSSESLHSRTERSSNLKLA
jgi:hypothetical protein